MYSLEFLSILAQHSLEKFAEVFIYSLNFFANCYIIQGFDILNTANFCVLIKKFAVLIILNGQICT